MSLWGEVRVGIARVFCKITQNEQHSFKPGIYNLSQNCKFCPLSSDPGGSFVNIVNRIEKGICPQYNGGGGLCGVESSNSTKSKYTDRYFFSKWRVYMDYGAGEIYLIVLAQN